MKKLISFGLLLASAIGMNAQQLPNIGFDNWKNSSGASYNPGNSTDYTRPGSEPENWCGSNVNQLDLASNDQLCTKQTVDANNYVQLKNLKVGALGITDEAPGFISLAKPWVFATASMTSAAKLALGDGGTYGGTTFANKPDALTLKYRKTAQNNEVSRVIAYMWRGTFTSQVPSAIKNTGTFFKPVWAHSAWTELEDVDRAVIGRESSDKVTASGVLVAHIDYEITADQASWQTLTIPFTYDKADAVPQKMNVIIAAGDYWNRSNLVENSQMDVDDVQFVYYHTLSSISYNGEIIASNPEEGSTIDCSNRVYDQTLMTYNKNGIGATIEESFNEESSLLTITVKGNDYNESTNSNSKSVYYIQFATPTVDNYTNSLIVNAKDFGGKQFYETKTIDVLTYTLSGVERTDLKIKDFHFNLEEKDLAVGDIVVTDLSKSTSGTVTTFSCNEKDVYIGGDLNMILPLTVTATISGTDMLATIDIILGKTVINVVFAPAVTMDGSAAITATGLTNVKVARSFKQGWNTLALPFAITTAELGTGVKAQEFSGVTTDGSGLNFTAVTSLEANKPYLVYFPAATDVAKYFGTNISAVDETCVTYGAYTFKPNFSNPSLSMVGNYGVVTADGVSKIMKGGAGSTLQTIRAYFTGNGAETARIYFDGETTGIDIITNAPANGKIYNLQGVEVSGKLPAGVYVKNGEKVIIK